MTLIRLRRATALAGMVSTVAAASALEAQSLPLDSLFRAHRHVVEYADDAVSGPGFRLLLESASTAQFVMVGESHNVREIPLFTASLFEALHERYGFNYLALEDGPYAVEMYGESGRFYHTLDHVAACLVEFMGVAGLAVHPFEVRLALWFHDVVYDARGGDNVEKSVDYTVNALAGMIDEGSLSRVCELIYATRHDDFVSGWDMGLVADIDLSILGKPRSVFDKYEEEIRLEYNWVPLED